MSVDAISTLEISVPYGSELAIEELLSQYTEKLAALPGCVSYGLTRSSRNSRLWVLTGHWESHQDMVLHFGEVDIQKLIEIFGYSSVGIQFGSFSKLDSPGGDDGVR